MLRLWRKSMRLMVNIDSYCNIIKNCFFLDIYKKVFKAEENSIIAITLCEKASILVKNLLLNKALKKLEKAYSKHTKEPFYFPINLYPI